MDQSSKPKPSYPLRDVKALIKEDKVYINPDAAQDAYDDFGWSTKEIKKCISKLNDRYYSDNHRKNHFHKTEPHRKFPNTMVDSYRAVNIMEGSNVYTHFYIHPYF